MKRIPPKIKQLFENWGQRGGLKRAQNLSSQKRSEIAVQAACTRWCRPPFSSLLSSVRIDNASLSDPVYVEEILSEGSWTDWQRLYQVVADRPFGKEAEAVAKTCSAIKIYGVTVLWQSLLRLLQGGVDEEKTSF